MPKWIFLLPEKRKILVVDAILNPFTHYFKENEMNIFYRRGEEINISILFLCLINLELSGLGYYKQYIKFAKPKIILTGIDYYPNFYRLSNLTKVKTAFFQRGRGSYMAGVFYEKKIFNIRNKKNFHVDYMFVHNKHVAKLYNSFTTGKAIPIGSFVNNMEKKFTKRKKKEILYISTYKPHVDYISDTHQESKNNNKSNSAPFFEYDKHVIKSLSNFANKNNLKLNILGRNIGIKINLENEKKYFDNIIDGKYNFLTSGKNKTSNKIVEEFEFVFTDSSTLGVDNLVKNGKTGFIFFKPDRYRWHTVRFGGIENLSRKGPFWTMTTTNNKKEFERVFKFVTKTNNKTWHKIRKRYVPDVMAYDRGNKKFLKIVNKCIN